MYQFTVEATTYSGCVHCSAHNALKEALEPFNAEVKRLTDKRERQEEFELNVPDSANANVVEKTVEEAILLRSSHQSVKVEHGENFTPDSKTEHSLP